MSKAIYVCTRNRPMGHAEETRIREICRKLTPDILASSVKHRVSVSGKIAFGNVSDPASSESVVPMSGHRVVEGYCSLDC